MSMSKHMLDFKCSLLAYRLDTYLYQDFSDPLLIYCRFLESVLGSTFNLFAASSDPEFGASVLQYMTPLHCLALVDPKATWFKKWMVS